MDTASANTRITDLSNHYGDSLSEAEYFQLKGMLNDIGPAADQGSSDYQRLQGLVSDYETGINKDRDDYGIEPNSYGIER